MQSRTSRQRWQIMVYARQCLSSIGDGDAAVLHADFVLRWSVDAEQVIFVAATSRSGGPRRIVSSFALHSRPGRHLIRQSQEGRKQGKKRPGNSR